MFGGGNKALGFREGVVQRSALFEDIPQHGKAPAMTPGVKDTDDFIPVPRGKTTDHGKSVNPFFEIRAKRFAEFGFVPGKIKEIIHKLERYPERIPEPSESFDLCGIQTPDKRPRLKGAREKRRGFFPDNIQMGLFGDVDILFFADLKDFAFADLARGLEKKRNDLFIPVAKDRHDRAIVKEIPRENRRLRA